MNFFLKNNKPLVILEMANNHMGDLSHAKKIINQYSKVTKKFKPSINFAIKFQFRDIETYIHKNFLGKSEDKYIARFFQTRLNDQEWNKLIFYAKSKFITICTPFDEISVKKIIKFKFDYLKIASCSMDEWPLLECISKFAKNKKIISSLGGGDENSIRNIISFFSSRQRRLNIKFLYCVATYPTEAKNLNLSYFSYLREIYGDKIMGFSTHENPDELISAPMAYAMGARIFEKHVALETKKYSKNAYSVNIEQFKKWLNNLNEAIIRNGTIKNRNKFLKNERKNLLVFKRGVYLNSRTKKNKGETLKKNNITLAFPAIKGQLLSNELSKFKTFKFKKNQKELSPIMKKNLIITDQRKEPEKIRDKIYQLIKISKVVVKVDSKLEISHHYGIKNFNKYGLTMITIHNSKYCKKLLFLLKNQIHPEQFHKKKQETFFILYGKIKLYLNKNKEKFVKILTEGEIYTIESGVIHKFQAVSDNGAVIEELSTNSNKFDSFYIDKKINNNKDRKTFISLN
jgi:sialic acid synthase SpsE/quercetin dioxygenase-like cupin family protein